MKEFQDIDFKAILDEMDQIIYISDPETYEILYVNKKTQDLFEGQIIGNKCYRILQDLESPCPFCSNDILFGKDPISPYIWVHYNKNINKWFHCIDYAIDWRGEKELRFEIAIDITERRESQERFRKLYDNIAGGTLIIDDEYKIKDVNERACEITGFSKAELIGQLCDIICPIGSKSKKCPIWEKKITGYQGMDTTVKCKNGDKTPILKNAKKINIGGQTYILEVFQDISDRKQAEKKLKEAYNKAEFYKDLLAHDMGNILNNIKASIQLMELHKKKTSTQEKKSNLIEMIKKQVKRGESLVSNAQKLSKIEKEEKIKKSVDVKRVLKETINHIQSRFKINNIEIHTEFPQDSIRIEGGPLLLDAFENIILNGFVHNESEQKTIWISITRVQKNGKHWTKIEFKDNGIGIIDERKDIIFNRDYNKDKSTGGMGLGLALVQKIIDEYNGDIRVENRIEGDYTQGSNFIILLKEI